MRAPSKNWADECSSDEGSIDEEQKEDNRQIPAGSKEKGIPSSKRNSNYVPKHEPENDFVAFISNFHYDIDRTELGTFFVDKGCTILNLELLPNNMKKNRSALIKFADVESLNICLNLSGEKIRGIPIKTYVYEDRKSHNRDYQKEQRDNPGKNKNDFDSRSYEKRQENDNTRKKIVKEEMKTSSGSTTIANFEAPVTRPRIIIQPRTLPLDTIGQILVAKPEIFGGGRPHDEQVYKQEKDKVSKIIKQEIPDTVFQVKSLNETTDSMNSVSNHHIERSDVSVSNVTVNSEIQETKIEKKVLMNSREVSKHRDHSKSFKDKMSKAFTANEKIEEVQKDGSYIIIKPNLDYMSSNIDINVITTQGSKSIENVPSKFKHKERQKKVVREKSATIDDQQDNFKKLTINKQGNKQGKSSENKQNQTSVKKSSGPTISTVSKAEQSEIERFHKAQERIGDKFDKGTQSSGGKVKNIVNTFAVFNNSDSEDD